MKIERRLLALPASLLLLLSSRVWVVSAEPESEDGLNSTNVEPANRYRSIQKRLAEEHPIAVRKMSNDPGEMFFLDYWEFGAQSPGSPTDSRKTESSADWSSVEDDPNSDTNATMSFPFLSPILLHSDTRYSNELAARYFRRSLLGKRDYQCPADTNACTEIDRPNSCCSEGYACVIIEDTGLGDVGCCGNGQTCGGQVSNCDTSAGLTSCPNDTNNGGCCIPDYTCDDIGCIISNTVTTTTTLAVVTVTASPSSISTSSQPPPPPSSSSTVVGVVPPPILTSTSTTTITPSATETPSYSSPLPSSTTPSSTGTVIPPVRPTSNPSTTTPPSPTTNSNICPTGYYLCSAYNPGGCCQVDRDCQSTSCPSPSTTLVVSSGATINGVATGGSCASGWFGCDGSLGGGCCPNGYGCGASCTLSVNGQASATVGKLPQSGAVEVRSWSLSAVFGLGVTVAVVVGML
ncbi:hypothetical protein K402DRAFT_456866 [Aulographum hederae CBS 113979]|uniref:GPI anchored protein n=1 Tax=Aulographum hederae CBS 113979 TaxID=1176131 RepID=A0A6G1GQE0_9PEZI|nr:hypothetical protein K402DRAFT_456866 [Aulographum hederae CBS 113979]